MTQSNFDYITIDSDSEEDETEISSDEDKRSMKESASRKLKAERFFLQP